MALDEVLFLSYLKTGIPFLRIYYWNKPSFSIGVSQNANEALDISQCQKDNVDVVRRMTGGGVLFHDQEITYSFGCSKNLAGEAQSVLISYKNVCRFLIEFYKNLGVNAQFALDMSNFDAYKNPSLICAASFEKYDIVVSGRKIGGNAQKRSKEFIFQHGIIPFFVDLEFMRKYLKKFDYYKVKESITYLYREINNKFDLKDLESKLINNFADGFGIKFEKSNLTDEEILECNELIANKYKENVK